MRAGSPRSKIAALDRRRKLLQYATPPIEGTPPLPPLTDPRREAWALAVAGGATKSAAYVEAGYVANRSGGTRMAAKAAVAARIGELVTRRETNGAAGTEETVAALLALAQAADAKTAAGAREARLARLEANRLWKTLATPRAPRPRPTDREMTEAEWTARFGHLTGG